MRLLPTLTCSLLAGFSLLASGLAAPPATAASRVSCAEIDLPVSVPTPRETVHDQLCMPAAGAPTTVQLLVHGATYNRVYWDFPYQPERYSYQRDMASHGYATFAIDRLGTGQSTRPPSVTLPAWSTRNRSTRSSVICAPVGSAGCASTASSWSGTRWARASRP